MSTPPPINSTAVPASDQGTSPNLTDGGGNPISIPHPDPTHSIHEMTDRAHKVDQYQQGVPAMISERSLEKQVHDFHYGKRTFGELKLHHPSIHIRTGNFFEREIQEAKQKQENYSNSLNNADWGSQQIKVEPSKESINPKTYERELNSGHNIPNVEKAKEIPELNTGNDVTSFIGPTPTFDTSKYKTKRASDNARSNEELRQFYYDSMMGIINPVSNFVNDNFGSAAAYAASRLISGTSSLIGDVYAVPGLVADVIKEHPGVQVVGGIMDSVLGIKSQSEIKAIEEKSSHEKSVEQLSAQVNSLKSSVLNNIPSLDSIGNGAQAALDHVFDNAFTYGTVGLKLSGYSGITLAAASTLLGAYRSSINYNRLTPDQQVVANKHWALRMLNTIMDSATTATMLDSVHIGDRIKAIMDLINDEHTAKENARTHPQRGVGYYSKEPLPSYEGYGTNVLSLQHIAQLRGGNRVSGNRYYQQNPMKKRKEQRKLKKRK